MKRVIRILYNKFDWYESLPKPINETILFIDRLKYKYKSYSFETFDELYNYLAINNKKELYNGEYKLSYVNDKYLFINDNYK